ncbi:MAG: adenosylcobinamide kinase/adenosylcobinamide phosphate guanyltransferase, partial [Propionibacterium sp.]
MILNSTLVLGGARSGKSSYAEGLLTQFPEVDYLATAPNRPGDQEWQQRIKLHQQRRPKNWRTIETLEVAE